MQRGFYFHGWHLSTHLLAEPQLVRLLIAHKQLYYLLAPSRSNKAVAHTSMPTWVFSVMLYLCIRVHFLPERKGKISEGVFSQMGL